MAGERDVPQVVSYSAWLIETYGGGIRGWKGAGGINGLLGRRIEGKWTNKGRGRENVIEGSTDDQCLG